MASGYSNAGSFASALGSEPECSRFSNSKAKVQHRRPRSVMNSTLGKTLWRPSNFTSRASRCPGTIRKEAIGGREIPTGSESAGLPERRRFHGRCSVCVGVRRQLAQSRQAGSNKLLLRGASVCSQMGNQGPRPRNSFAASPDREGEQLGIGRKRDRGIAARACCERPVARRTSAAHPIAPDHSIALVQLFIFVRSKKPMSSGGPRRFRPHTGSTTSVRRLPITWSTRPKSLAISAVRK